MPAGTLWNAAEWQFSHQYCLSLAGSENQQQDLCFYPCAWQKYDGNKHILIFFINNGKVIENAILCVLYRIPSQRGIHKALVLSLEPFKDYAIFHHIVTSTTVYMNCVNCLNSADLGKHKASSRNQSLLNFRVIQ